MAADWREDPELGIRYSTEFEHRLMIREQYNEYGPLEIFEPEDVVLDVGASFGETAAFAFKTGGSKRVVSIEPFPGNVALLRANFADDERVRIIEAAVVGDLNTEKHVDLWVPKNRRRVNNYSTVRYQHHQDEERIAVPALRVSEALALDEFTLAKFDIEGAEYDIFVHGPEVEFPASIRKLVIEFHVWRKAWRGDLAHRLVRRLEAQGFTLHPKSRTWNEKEWTNVMGWTR